MMFTKLALVDPTRLDPKHLEYKELSESPQVVVKAGLDSLAAEISRRRRRNSLRRKSAEKYSAAATAAEYVHAVNPPETLLI
jgi:hypothetical protein